MPRRTLLAPLCVNESTVQMKERMVRIFVLQINGVNNDVASFSLFPPSEMKSPAAKKQRKESSKQTASLLLGSSPEILRHVRSFLMLKESLVLRSTCRQLHNDNNDVFRYSHIFGAAKAARWPVRMVDAHALEKYGFSDDDRSEYLRIQDYLLERNLQDNCDKLRALLLNTTFCGDLAGNYLANFIRSSKTDNGEAVSILLEDGRCHVNPYMLDDVLQKDFTEMAAVLQQNEVIKAGIQMCTHCSENIGCYDGHDCANYLACKGLPELQFDDPKYCRACVLSNDLVCKNCEHRVCPMCVRQESFHRCVECEGIVCLDSDECYCPDTIRQCNRCGRTECDDCIRAGGGEVVAEDWHYCSSCCSS